MTWRIWKKRRLRGSEVFPEDIFLDSKNLPAFNTQQFEGRIEQPIKKNSVVMLGGFVVFIGIVFIFRLGNLQIVHGDAYFERSEDNRYNQLPIFAERGVIYDRNGIELVWNRRDEGEEVPTRAYTRDAGFSHILGYVSYPKKDRSGFYWQEEFIGQSGVEKEYDELLEGVNGEELIERDVFGNPSSESNIISPVSGSNIYLTVDAKVQNEMHKAIAALAESAGYDGGAGVMIDITNGEVIAMTSYPEYDAEALSLGKNTSLIGGYRLDSRKPYLNRTIAGIYTPGSIVKPFLALGALTEGIIDPEKEILSTGSIVLQSPYDPDITYTYKDNKAHGWVDMRRALAVSSNVYFYEISGGYQDQKGLGISNIGKYTGLFDLDGPAGIEIDGEKTGVIPSPEWKAKNFKGDIWRIGDTYNTAIGQYGFQTTPLAMARSIGAVANGGTLVTPHLLKDDSVTYTAITIPDVSAESYDVVQEGMRMVVTEGTGQALNYLPFNIAEKSGTAQVGISKRYVNAWLIGFFPYENPKYAFAFLMEHGPGGEAVVGASRAALPFFTWLGENAPQYTK